MKHLFVIIMLTLGVSMSSFAQDNTRMVFKAGHAEITNTQDWNEGDLLPITGSPVIITVNPITDYDLTITNQFGDKFTTTDEVVNTMMSDGHECTMYFYDAFDSNGSPCEIIIRFYKDGHTWGDMYRYNFRIFYSNVWYGYYANVYDPDEPKSLGEKDLNVKQL